MVAFFWTVRWGDMANANFRDHCRRREAVATAQIKFTDEGNPSRPYVDRHRCGLRLMTRNAASLQMLLTPRGSRRILPHLLTKLRQIGVRECDVSVRRHLLLAVGQIDNS